LELFYHPQQSVLNPQHAQRQTACMRYISAPQRSQSVGASDAGAGGSEDFSGLTRAEEGSYPFVAPSEEKGVRPLFRSGSAIGPNYGMACQPKLKLSEMSTSAASRLRRPTFA
jgi:hypothetical protein